MFCSKITCARASMTKLSHSAAIRGSLRVSAHHWAVLYSGISPRQQKPAVQACSEDKHPPFMPPYPIIGSPPCDPAQRLANTVMSPYSNFEHSSTFRWGVQRCPFLTALEQAIADHPSLPLLLLLQLPLSLLGSFALHTAFSTTPVSPYPWSPQGSLQLHHLLLHNAQAAVSYSSCFRSTAWSQLGEVMKPLTLPWAVGRHTVPTPSQ